MSWWWYLSVSLTSHGMIISTFFPVASLGIISYFLCDWEILHSVHVPHSLYQFNCASTISLISCLGYYTLWGQNQRVTHLFLNSLAVFSTPPQFKYETQAGSGSRDGIAAQIKEVAGNKLGIDFFLFVFLNLMLKLCQCSQFAVLCLLLVYNCLIQLWHIYTAYLFLFQFFCHRDYCRSSSKVPLAEHQVLLEHLWQLHFLCIYGRKEGDNPFGLPITATDFCVYVSPYLWIHPCFSFLFMGTLCV